MQAVLPKGFPFSQFNLPKGPTMIHPPPGRCDQPKGWLREKECFISRHVATDAIHAS